MEGQTIAQRLATSLQRKVESEADLSKFKFVGNSIFSIMRTNFKRMAPPCIYRFICCCKICKPSLRDQLFLKANSKFRAEISIVNLLEKVRVLQAAVKATLPRKQWKQIKSTTRKKKVWFDDIKESQSP